ncbi:MAG: N-succinylarginine dihydrolase, partial [Verrucomicrobiota bacterium]
DFLRQIGFTGSPEAIIQQAALEAPEALSSAFSSSFMWTANAATISPAADTADGKIHMSVANLTSQLHRSLEAPATAQILQTIFPDPDFFVHHAPLPAPLRDEGAANHLRLAPPHSDEPGLEIFVYGPPSTTFPARQTFAASQAIARRHQLAPDRTYFLAQSPEAIDAGVFHTDVISVSNGSVLLYHEDAFQEEKTFLRWMDERLPSFLPIRVSRNELSLDAAIRSYLFNSQLLSVPPLSSSMLLLCPKECGEEPKAASTVARLLEDETNPIQRVETLSVRESMRNGGGPACLRLRIRIEKKALASVHEGYLYGPSLHQKLENWIKRHYRDDLSMADLATPDFLEECAATERNAPFPPLMPPLGSSP